MTGYGLIMVPGYQAPYTSPAAPNNTNLWKGTLPKRDITPPSLCVGAGATRAGIISSFQYFISRQYYGDVGVAVFCGHGATDGVNQCIVGSDLQPVWDFEIQAMMALKAPGARVHIITDCCYAGEDTTSVLSVPKVSRPDPLKAPKIDENVRPDGFKFSDLRPIKGKLLAVPYKEGEQMAVPPSINHTHWAAGGPNQITYIVSSGGLWYGLFSLYAAWVLGATSLKTKTATELMSIIKSYVMAAVPAQVPQLEGINQDMIPF